jgi:hypothetical protein
LILKYRKGLENMNIDTAGGEIEMPKKKVGHVHEVSGRGLENHPVEVEEE